MAIKPIQILINAKDNASGVFSRLQKTVAGIGAALAGYFGISAFAGAVRGAAELEAKLSEVQAVSGATTSELQDMRKAAEAAGATTQFTATEAADALGNLARAGLSSADAIKALPATLQLAQAGGLGLAQSSEIVTKTLAGFGFAASEAGRVADVLAKGANASNTSVEGLGQALSYAAPVAVSLGLSLEQTTAIIGKFADAGIDASRAGTALNSILSQFSDPASKFRRELAAAGITTTDFGKALEQLAAAGPAGQKAVLAVGQEAGPALRALLNQGIGSLTGLQRVLEAAGGSAAATAKLIEDNLLGAFKGLGSAWDAVKIGLLTPVLPVLRQGVEQLTTSLREAVSDGTVAKFGNAIAEGFRSALDWAKSFLSTVDFAAIAASISSAAEKTGAAFDAIAIKAQTAGNTVQTAWGVMSAGVNVLLAGIYKLGELFASVAGGIQNSVAGIATALSKISFGSLSESFRAAAAEIQLSADATLSVADAFNERAADAFAAVAEGAELARKGWDGLTSSTEAATTSLDIASAATKALTADLGSAAQSAEALGSAAQTASAKQVQAAQAAKEEVARLRQAYQEALDAGNAQGALEALQKIQQELKKTSDQASATAAEIDAAFARMGVQTKEQLADAAANALRDFKLIEDSGRATADGLADAFRRYAESAIAANGGVATEALKSQAAMRGLSIEVDSAGKTIVRGMKDAADATEDVGDSARQSAQGYSALALSAEDAAAAVERAAAAERKRRGVDKDGFSVDKDGNRIVMGNEYGSLTGIYNIAKNAGLTEVQARKLALEFSDGQGNIPYMNNPGQKRYGDKYGSLSTAVWKAIEQITFSEKALRPPVEKKETDQTDDTAAGQRAGVGGAGAGVTSSQRGSSVSINLSLSGSSRGSVQTDAAGADVLQSFLAELAAAKRSAM